MGFKYIYEEDGLIKTYPDYEPNYVGIERFTNRHNAMYDERIAAEKRKADEGNA